jgi:hypothetical protein
MRKFTPAEDQFLRDNYLIIPAKRMAKMLGRCESVSRQRMKILNIVVPDEVKQKFVLDSYFNKGAPPPNKGKKLSEYVSPESIEKMKATQFPKGHLPVNTKADLSVSIRADKRGVPYKFIRVAKREWIPLHRYNWIQVNGPITKKLKLVFKDGDTMNCDINNLELFSPADFMRKNSVHNLPKPLAQIVQLRGVLHRQINKHVKRLSK